MNTTIVFCATIVAIILVMIVHRLAGRKAAAIMVLPLVLLCGIVAYVTIGYTQERRIERQTARIVASLEADPLFLAIRDADGSTYARIMNVVNASRTDPYERREALVEDRSTKIMERLLKERTASMNDEMTIQTMRLQLANLKRDSSKTGLCTAFFDRGKTALAQELRHGPDARRYLTALLRSAPDSSPAVSSASEVRESMVVMMPFVLQKSGITVEQFLAPGSTVAGNCSFVIGLMETLSALPAARAAPIVRGMTGT